MKNLKINNIEFEIPETWNELPKKDFLWLCNNFENLLKPSYDFKIRFLIQLLHLKFMDLKKQKAMLNVSDLQIKLLSDLTNVFFPLHEINLTINKLNTIKYKFVKLIGPSDNLMNATLAEFSYADKYFSNFLKTQKIEELNKLCATLFRPTTFFSKNINDKRVSFNSYSVSQDAKTFEKIKMQKKIAILLFYWGVRNTLAATFTNLFNGDNEAESSSLKLGWIALIFNLSGPKFGTIEETQNAPLYVALSYIEDELILNKKRNKPTQT